MPIRKIIQKYIFVSFIFLPAFFLFPFPAGAQEIIPAQDVGKNSFLGSRFDSYSVQAGYVLGDLKASNSGDLEIAMTVFRLARKINSFFGLDTHKGTINMVVEPFLGHIVSPENHFLAGSALFFEYVYPLTKRWKVHTGFGAGPSFFGADTIEEGSGGFQFFDSASAGFRYQRENGTSLLFEYRAVHISDLGIRNPDNGLNGHAVFFGFNKDF